jgi:hypothetical protein
MLNGILSSFDVERANSDALYWVQVGIGAFCAMTALKHRSWEHEREVRLIYVQAKQKPEGELAAFPTADVAGREMMYWTAPQVRQSANGAVAYVKFPFGRRQNDQVDHSRAIEKVVLGPNCRLTPSEVDETLVHNGFQDFRVEASECLIR